MSIGTNIKTLRESNGFTQAELAQKVGVTPSMITQLERNSKVLTLPLGYCIAEALHCSMYDFVEEQTVLNRQKEYLCNRMSKYE